MSGNGNAIVKKRGNNWGGKRAGAGPPGNQNAATHSMVALAKLLRKGLDPGHPVGRILSERRQTYVADLGGPENCSGMEMGIAEKMARLDLMQALLDCRSTSPLDGKARRLSLAKTQSLALVQARLTDSFVRAASALGIRKRERDVHTIAEVLRAEMAAGDDPDA